MNLKLEVEDLEPKSLVPGLGLDPAKLIRKTLSQCPLNPTALGSPACTYEHYKRSF